MKLFYSSLLTLLLFTVGAASAHASARKGEDYVKSLAMLEVYKQEAYRIPSVPPVETIEARLNDHLHKMLILVQNMADDSAYRKGGAALLRIVQELGHGDELKQWSANIFSRNYNHCDSFISCSDLLSDLSSTVDLAPTQVGEVLDHSLLPTLSTLTEKLTKNDLVKFNNSSSQRILLYRAQSLRLFARFYQATALRAHPGKTPTINPYELSNLKTAFAALDSSLSGLLPEARFAWEDASAYEMRISTFRERLADSIFQDIHDFEHSDPADEAEIQKIGVAIADSILSTQVGNGAVSLYLERVNLRNLQPWLQSLHDRIQQKNIDLQTVFLMTVYFNDTESYLPYRTDWLELMKKAAAPDSPAEMMVTQQAEKVFEIRIAQLNNFLQKEGYQNNGGTPSLAARMLQSEKKMAADFAIFHSLYYQSGLLTQSQNRLALNNAAYDAKKNDENLAFSFQESFDSSVVNWLNLACYTEAEMPNGKNNPKNDKIAPFFAASETYRLSKICTGNLRESYGSVGEAVLARRKQILWRPLQISLAIDFISIPVMLLSSGASGLVAKPVEEAAVRFGMKMATEYAFGRLSKYLAARLVPRLIAAMTGSVVYLAVSRVSMYAITLGRRPLYESDKSLVQNYGKDLLMGNAIMFFSPYTQALSKSVGQAAAVAAKSGTSSAFVHQFSALSGRVMVETGVFTSIPYFERWMMKEFGRSKDPVLRGWMDFVQISGHATAMTLAFNVKTAAAH